MSQKKHSRMARIGMAASIVSAFGASVCCIGPVLAVMFGVTSLAALAKFEPLRPILAVVTVALLGAAFYATYRRPADCEPGSLCETHGPDRVHKLNRIALWIASLVALVVFTFPTWSAWVLV